MEYNVAKCEVIHFGRSNSKRDYYLNDKILKHANVQRDLGVLVHETQKVGVQVQQVIKKANRVLSFIARGMEFKTREVMLQLYKVLVRATYGVLCSVLVSSPEKGHTGIGGSAEEIH